MTERKNPLEAQQSKLIPLRRVEFVEVEARPPNIHDKMPGNDKIMERYPIHPPKALFLWLTPDLRFVYVQDPESLEVHEVPITRVHYLQRLTDYHLELAKNPVKPAGLRNNLELPKPQPLRT